jgi:hypothetical protein
VKAKESAAIKRDEPDLPVELESTELFGDREFVKVQESASKNWS